MKKILRRDFMKASVGLLLIKREKPYIMTIGGKIRPSEMGITLSHEHILVDFIGADQVSNARWSKAVVIDKMLPYLIELKKFGVKTFVDCTPNYLGRDVELFNMLAEKTGLKIITNTGYYGARQYKYFPQSAFIESAEQIAKRWIDEADNGIDGTDIRPGFMKIGVNGASLTDLEQKLVKAAGITHLKTGLTICSHTGPALSAFQQVDLLEKMGVAPNAFVWVHAQGEVNKNTYAQAAKRGAWVSLDGMGWGDWENYANWLELMKANKFLNRVLISHDAGWYDPEKPNGGEIKGYTSFFEKVMPILKTKGFTKKDFLQLLEKNPAEAFSIRVRKI